MTEQEERQLSFLPFHAINHFMRDDFRREVVRTVVMAENALPGKMRADLGRLIRRLVAVPGFRNAGKAPAALKARHLPDAFEKGPDLVAVILAGWAWLKKDLAEQVESLLVERSWEILPASADRTNLPGFLTQWPAGENFDGINDAFAEKYPGSEASQDEVSLMVVWLSGRLPVDAA